MASLTISGLGKAFGRTSALDGIDLAIPSGAFTALLGPSGCGKTTLLRLIAGLERPSRGRIAIGEAVVADANRFVEAQDRGLGMVFQSYALWPHMSVHDNVAFGLSLRPLSRAEREARVAEALDGVGLTGLGARKPSELSGGQRQRVALARCLALRPPLVLLDEPLANLDAHLKGAMQREFRRIHRESGTTFVYVTHDQGEAMALADRIAVMDRGRLQQVAAPADLYRRPANATVARFVGNGALVPVEVLARDGERCRMRLGSAPMEMPGLAPPGPGLLCLRPENLRLGDGPAAGPEPAFAARVGECTYGGDAFLLDLTLADAPNVVVQVRSERPARPGEDVRVSIAGGWVLPDAAPPA